ncbi:MAG: hypothetical protein WDA75_18240 [Candidatus Latescibacterota bacterium]|jgi:hypothetical protein
MASDGKRRAGWPELVELKCRPDPGPFERVTITRGESGPMPPG